ncbi:MAG: methylmalonyl-CoA mutase family protein, partial [Candidatus Thorarchaeota archaeon]
YQKEIEKKERTIVGVNDFIVENEDIGIPVLKIDEAIERTQVERLQKTRDERDNAKLQLAMDGLRKASEGDENVMPHIVACVREYASVGEIMDLWREIWGEWDEPIVF